MGKTKINVNKKDVVLEIDDLSGCCFELWNVEGITTTSVKIKIPEKVWNNIIDKYEKIRGKK